jgi:hypothetical protein
MRALAHLFIQREHVQAPDTKQHILQKIVGVQKRWVTIQAVEQVNPTAQNTSRLYKCFALYARF